VGVPDDVMVQPPETLGAGGWVLVPVRDADQAGHGVGTAVGVGQLVDQPARRDLTVGVGACQPEPISTEFMEQCSETGPAGGADVSFPHRENRGVTGGVGSAVGARIEDHQQMNR
jgi:hypothetical protein